MNEPRTNESAYRAILTKRDTRAFLPEPVADDDLTRVLQAGRMTGSAKNSQLNRMVVVTEAAQCEQLRACGKFADWVGTAPVMIAIVIPAEGGRMVDVGRMAQNLMLAAHSLGLASCPVTFQDQDCVRSMLGLPPDLEAPMGVGLGHPAPAEPGQGSSPRIPLDELVHRGRWRS